RAGQRGEGRRGKAGSEGWTREVAQGSKTASGRPDLFFPPRAPPPSPRPPRAAFFDQTSAQELSTPRWRSGLSFAWKTDTGHSGRARYSKAPRSISSSGAQPARASASGLGLLGFAGLLSKTARQRIVVPRGS